MWMSAALTPTLSGCARSLWLATPNLTRSRRYTVSAIISKKHESAQLGSPAAWRYSPRSAAPRLLLKQLSRRAPTIHWFRPHIRGGRRLSLVLTWFEADNRCGFRGDCEGPHVGALRSLRC